VASLSRALVRNWRLKLSAFGLSVFLWALVQTEPTNPETLPSVPVRVQIADTGWTTSGTPTPATVELRLAGPAREIIRLAREGASLRIPIQAVGSRDTTVTLRREWVQLGQRSGLTVESVSPASVRISFEPARTRLVPLAARLVGSVGDRLALASEIEVSPQLVRVRGPESRMEGLDSLPLMPFDLSAIQRSGAFTVAVDTAGMLGASVVPPLATLGVRVEDVIERVLTVSVRADAAAGEEEVLAEPALVQVRLVGGRSRVTAVDTDRLIARVAPELLQGMTTGEERIVPLRLEGVPSGVTAVSLTDRVRVRRAIDGGGGPRPGGPQ
jgi:YbbR domain-containing protein